MDYDYDTITLVDDNGVEKDFYILVQIELEDEHKVIYVIADPDTMDDDEPYIDACYYYTDSDEEEFYFVDDPEELDMIDEVLGALPENSF